MNIATPPELFLSYKDCLREDGGSLLVHSDVPYGVTDIDDKSFATATFDPTYAKSIYLSKKRLESRYIQKTAILLNRDGIQTEITPNTRLTLIDWLINSCHQYWHVDSSTYHLAIQYIDHALSLIHVKLAQFQLLGVACLWLASKLEELHPPQVEDLIMLADNCFGADELILYEQRLMRIFENKASIPTRHYFATRFVLAAKCSPREVSLVQYLVELSLYDVRFLCYPMSLIAATAVHLALQTLRPLTVRTGEFVDGLPMTSPNIIWTSTLRYYTEYEELALVPVMYWLRSLQASGDMLKERSECKSVYRKYESSGLHKVSHLTAVRHQDIRFQCKTAQDAWTKQNHNMAYSLGFAPVRVTTAPAALATASTDNKLPGVDIESASLHSAQIKVNNAVVSAPYVPTVRPEAAVHTVQPTAPERATNVFERTSICSHSDLNSQRKKNALQDATAEPACDNSIAPSHTSCSHRAAMTTDGPKAPVMRSALNASQLLGSNSSTMRMKRTVQDTIAAPALSMKKEIDANVLIKPSGRSFSSQISTQRPAGTTFQTVPPAAKPSHPAWPITANVAANRTVALKKRALGTMSEHPRETDAVIAPSAISVNKLNSCALINVQGGEHSVGTKRRKMSWSNDAENIGNQHASAIGAGRAPRRALSNLPPSNAS